MSVLVARHLSKSYKSRLTVKDVSFTVNSGEIVGLLGPNGAGKTTSFHMMVGLLATDGGSIHINNREITHLPMDQRSRLGLGYLPQESSVFKKLSVEDNIMSMLELQDNLRDSERQRRLEGLLEEFHITHLRQNPGASLSGGERRRLEIARALTTNPQFLLLDEPFAGIDPISVNDIQRITKYLCRHGIGILITDHNVRETLGSCDRAYILNDGTIMAEGTPEEILANDKVREVYLGDDFRL